MVLKKIKKIRALRFLKKLDLLLSKVSKIYLDYHDNNKIFKYAKRLRIQNEKIRVLLHNNIKFLNSYSNKKEALELLRHINEWRRLWDIEFKKNKPNEEDQFCFENKISFPKESVDSLINSKKYYL